jgi:putative transposase
MRRAKTPSFIGELPLVITPAAERQLLIRLDCARQIYNACLGESLQRLRQMRQSESYRAAQKLPKKTRERATAFAAVRQQFGFREYDLHTYAKQFGHSWLGEHLDSLTIQKVATRAFLASQRYAIGQSGKPRFKGKGGFDSLEGKTNLSGILWRDNSVKWLGLELPAIIDPKDDVIAHDLSCPIKFVRVVRRKLNGRNRFYVQLVCQGQPHRKVKHLLGQGVVGLDIGPSTLAVVSRQSATLERFCDDLQSQQKDIRKLQRQLDRLCRANNAQNYQPDGTVKKGVKRWRISRRYRQTRQQIAELHRRQAAHRRSLHGRLVNRLLAQGNTFKLEKLSYRAFQRQFGKSVGVRAPGQFVSHLKRKAANAGAEVDEFSTRSTRLSQLCLCGRAVKKALSQRWHVCDCGVGPVQRDVFSAWLATFVIDERLDADRARSAWSGEDERLRVASSAIEPTMRQGQPPAPNLHQNVAAGQSRSLAQSGGSGSEAHAIRSREGVRELAYQPEPPAFRRGE